MNDSLIPASLFSWEGKQGTAEISVLSHHGLDKLKSPLFLKSDTTGKVKEFHIDRTDFTDYTHEDIAGWNFSSIDGIRILIIND